MKLIFGILLLEFLSVFSIRKNIMTKIINKLDKLNKENPLKIIQFYHTMKSKNNEMQNYEIGRAMLMAKYKELYNIKKLSMKSLDGNNILHGVLEYEELFNENEITKEMMEKQLIVKMAGQAAISIYYFKKIIDLEKTTDFRESEFLAKRIILKHETIKPNLYYDLEFNEYLEKNMPDEKTKNENKHSKMMVYDAYFKAMDILLFHKDKMDILINELKNNREVDRDIIYIYMNKNIINSDLDREM
jgi:ATP-dependent Zn protease